MNDIEYVALLSRVWEAAGGTRDQLPINDEMENTVLSLVRQMWMEANEVQDETCNVTKSAVTDI